MMHRLASSARSVARAVGSIRYYASKGDSVMPQEPIELFSKDGNVNTTQLFKGRKVLVVGIPGAFTPVCQTNHVPGFVKNVDSLLKKGIDEVAVVSVNDHFVMGAFAEETGAKGSKVRVLADPQAKFTKMAKFDVDLGAALGVRSKRYAMLVDNGVVSKVFVEEKPSDLKVSSADALLNAL